MANVPQFNPELDKITEREMVYDIVSRLMIGKDLIATDGSDTVIYSPPAKLKAILTDAIMALPQSIALNLAKIEVYTIDIEPTANGTTTFIQVDREYPFTLLLAYSEKTMTDISSVFKISSDRKSLTYVPDSNYINKDRIKLYYIYDEHINGSII